MNKYLILFVTYLAIMVGMQTLAITGEHTREWIDVAVFAGAMIVSFIIGWNAKEESV